MAELTQGTGTVVLTGLRDSSSAAADSAATRGYVDSVMPHASARDFIVVDNAIDMTGLRGVNVNTVVYVIDTRVFSRVTSVNANGQIIATDPIEIAEYVVLPTQASGNTTNVAIGDIVRVGTDVYVATSTGTNLTQISTLPSDWIELTADTNTTYQFNNTLNSGSTLGVAFTNNANVITATVDASALSPHITGTWHTAANQAARDALTNVTVGDYVLQEDLSQVERVTATQGTTNRIGTAERVTFGLVQLTANPIDIETFTIAVDRTNDRVYLNTDSLESNVTITTAPNVLTELTGTGGGNPVTYSAGTAITIDNTNRISVTAAGITTTQLANDAVTQDKLADNSVGSAQIIDNSVGSTEIANGAVGVIQLADNAVETAKLDAESVTAAKLASNSVTSAKIADNAVTASEILDGAVSAAELAVNSNGTSGQLLTSVGDGTFSWTDAIESISDISREWPTSFSGFSGTVSLTAGDIWRENGIAGQAFVYAGADVPAVTSANFVDLEPVDDNPIWRQIAGHSLFNWPASAPMEPFTILHGTIWNGRETEPLEAGVYIWTGGDEQITSSTYASFTPRNDGNVHDWRLLSGTGTGGGGGTTVVPVTNGSTNQDTTLTGITIAGDDYSIPGAISAFPGSYQEDFDIKVNSLWSRTVASQLIVWRFTGHSDTTVVSSTFADYIPQSSSPHWTELGAEGAANTYPRAGDFQELFFARLGSVWQGSDANLYLATSDHVIHNEGTRTSNDPVTTTSGWRPLNSNLPVAPASNSTSAQNYELRVSATGDNTSWVAATTGGGGGGADLANWAETTAYDPGNVVINAKDFEIYQARERIEAGDVTTPVPNVSTIGFGNVSTHVGVYIITFAAGTVAPTPDSNTVYTVAAGAPYNVEFTVMGSAITSTIATVWLIAPSNTTLVSGVHASGLQEDSSAVAVTTGATVTNPPPNLDSGPAGRWQRISVPLIDDPLRYDLHTGLEIRWREGATTFVGTAQFVNTNTVVIGPNNTSISGTTVTTRGLPVAAAQAAVDATRLVTHIDDLAAYRIFDTTSTTPAQIAAGTVVSDLIAQVGDAGQIIPTTIEGLVDGVTASAAPLTVREENTANLATWSSGDDYAVGDMVVDVFDYHIYKADVAITEIVGAVPVPDVRQVAFGNSTGFTELRYLVEFEDAIPTIDLAETYRFDIGGVLGVDFTVQGSDISTTDIPGFWVVSPTATSYTVLTGSTPTMETQQPTPVISITIGTVSANPRPGLDTDRWTEVSDTSVDYAARYSPSRGETLRWTEGSSELVGAVEDIYFHNVLAADSTVAEVNGEVRYTISGVLPSVVTALVAADRVVFTSARTPIRTFGTVTAGSTPDEAILVGTCLQSDGDELSDASIVGAGILARGPVSFFGSFGAVSFVPESSGPTNTVEDFHSVADQAARQALTASQVKFGDVVFQQDTKEFWEATHETGPVANYLNFTWAASLVDGSRELALHFSDLASMPISGNTYSLVSGGDAWSFNGSSVTTRTAINNTIEWRIRDASVGGSPNRTGLRRAGSLTTTDGDITYTLITATDDPVVSLTEDNQTLTVTVDGVSASVQTRDVKFGGTLPSASSSLRGEVYVVYGNGYRDANLHIFDGTAWQSANLNIGDLEVAGEADFLNSPQVPGHSRSQVTGTGNANDAATITDVRIIADVLREEFGHTVSPHGVLEQEPGTSYRHVQGIELGGDFADDPNGTFRHARLVDQSVEYPTVRETVDANANTNNAVNSTFGASFVPLQAGLFPSAPLRGQQGSVHDTFRLQQYHNSADAAMEVGLGHNSGQFIAHDRFNAMGGLADNPNDPSGTPINARYHLRGEGLIDSDAASGSLTTRNGGYAIGMVFSPTGAAYSGSLDDEALWSMDFGAGSPSDDRNVGVFMEETPGETTIPVGDINSAEWLEDGAFLDLQFNGQITPVTSTTIIYTLTLRDASTIRFYAHDTEGNSITERDRFGYHFWRIPRALIIDYSGGAIPDEGYYNGIALDRTGTDHYRIRVKQGTNQTDLLSDVDGFVELNPNNTYNIVSYLHLNSDNRITINVRLFDWNSTTESWDIRSSLGHTGTLVGYRVTDSTTTNADRIHLTSPRINIGQSEYRSYASVTNNRITMSKTFIARSVNLDAGNTILDAMATSESPFRGLIVSAASDGYEIQDLPYVDIPYTAYDNATKTITPAANWLVPNIVATPTDAQRTQFRNSLNSDGSWTPVSVAAAADGTYNGTTTNTNARIETVLPNQGSENISTSDVRQFWIHPTGSGYVDPVVASSSFSQMNPRTGMSSNVTFNVPQGPIQGLTYFTTSGTDGASAPITFLNGTNTGGSSLNWETRYFLGDGSAGTVRVYSLNPSTVSSVSHNLVSPGGTRRIYVPGFRDDYRTATDGVSPLTAADLDANTHYFRGLFLDGMGRTNYFQIVNVDTATGLLSVIRVDNDVANSNDQLPTGRNIELPFGPGSENLDLQQFASFQFRAETPREQDSIIPLQFDPVGIWFGVAGTPVGVDTEAEYYEPMTRFGVTYYWYPNKVFDPNNDPGVFQSINFTGTTPPDGEWIFPLIG